MDILSQIRLRLRHLADVIRALRIMEICPCSPDVGDCSKCKHPDGSNKSIQSGSFTKQALQKHMTPKKFAVEAMKHPNKNALKTRRRAHFLKNIKMSSRKTSRRK